MNSWVRYFDRSYQQIKDRVITELSSRTPEITDHTESNLFIKIISIFSGIVEMVGYYVDNAARETYLQVNRLYENAIKIAYSFDYNVKISSPADVDLTFTLENPALTDVTIPQYTEVSGSAYTFSFLTNEALVILAGDTVGTVGAQQKAVVNNLDIGTTDGSQGQVVVLSITNVAKDSIVASINGDVWQGVDTLAYSTSTDKHFVVSVNEDVKIYLQFGDGVNGEIPTAGFSILINYFETVGSAGNDVIANSLDTIESVVAVPVEAGELNVINNLDANGGTDFESLEELKLRIPKSLRTLDRALTLQDYRDLTDLYVGVLKSEVEHTCGQPASIYIVPSGGGIASQTLLDDVKTYFDNRKAINMLVRTFTAGQVLVDLTVSVNVLQNYQNSSVQAAVLSSLNTLLSWENQDIGGEVYLSDLYQVVDNTEGVRNSKFSSIVFNSFPRPTSTVVSTFSVVVVPNATNVTNFKYNVIFVSTTTFQLTRNSVLLGVFTTGTTINLTEGDITVTGTYVVAESWEFYMYGNIILLNSIDVTEYSVPVAGNLTINVSGGY